MYNVKLDENKYFTGSYAVVGGIDGGIDLPTLPPDMDKAQFYKYDYRTVTTYEMVPIIGEDGFPAYKEVAVPKSFLDWIFDEELYNRSILNNLNNAKEEKIKVLGTICNKNIVSGIDINTTVGTEHFSLSDMDQANIKNAYDVAKSTNMPTLYHADGKACRVFSVGEIKSIYINMLAHIAYQTTLCNMLNTWVRRSTDIDDINSIQYNSVLPDDLQALLNVNMEQSSAVVNAFIES